MASVDFTAVRNEAIDPRGPGPTFAGGAEHLVDAIRRPPRAVRLRRLAPGTAVSVVVHVAITIAGLMIWRAMVQDLTAPEPISVEIVHSIPGEGAAEPAPPPPAAPSPAAPQTAPEPPRVEPKASPSPDPPPKRSVLDDALPKPDVGGAVASPPPGAPPGPGAPGGSAPPATGATPAPAVVAPPPEPRAAVTQPDKAQVATTSDLATPAPRPPPPAEAPPVPPVLAAPGGDVAVPAPSPATETAAKADKSAEPDPRAAPDPTAVLAAALPQSPFALPSTFRALLSGQGTSDDSRYKGAVFGLLGRGRAHEVAEQAERRGLKGQVVVRFTVGDAGDVEDVSIVQSSGKPAVDEAAEAMVRGAAPYPPPPPGGQRVFTPALAFGG